MEGIQTGHGSRVRRAGVLGGEPCFTLQERGTLGSPVDVQVGLQVSPEPGSQEKQQLRV